MIVVANLIILAKNIGAIPLIRGYWFHSLKTNFEINNLIEKYNIEVASSIHDQSKVPVLLLSVYWQHCFFFFSFLIFNFFPPKCCQMCTFFCLTWKRAVIFLVVIHVFWKGYFFTGLGDRRVLSPPQWFWPAASGNIFGKYFPEKVIGTSLEITNSLSCEHVSKLLNGRQFFTFPGFFFVLLTSGRKIFEDVCFV